MPTDIERLLVRIEPNLRQFERQLKGVNAQTRKTTMGIERDFARANSRVEANTRRAMQGVKASIASVAGGLGAERVLAYGDAWTEAGNKIAAASQISGRRARSLNDLNDIADETRSGISETVDLYAKLLRSTKDVAKSEDDVARATAIVNKAFKAGGAAASEQAAGILQLGQGLSSGFLQGDELRSLRENAPLIAQAIAEEFGTTIGGLKELGAEGELVSARVFQAILAAQAPIEAAFEKTNTTIGAGFTRLQNALIQYIGEGDKSIAGTERLVSALDALANNLDLVALAATGLAVRGAAPLTVALVSRLAPAAATAATALRLLTVSGGAAIVATSALTRSMALLGGPIGIVLFAASGLALAFASSASASEDLARSTGDTKATLSEISRISADLTGDYADLERAQRALAKAQQDGGEAAVAAAVLDVRAVNDRIEANKRLRQELAIIAREQLRDAKENLAKLEQAEFDAARRRLAASKGLNGPGIGRSGVNSELSRRLGLDEQAVRDFIDAERDAAIAASEAGERLDEQQLATVRMAKAVGEARAEVGSLSAKVDGLSEGADDAADSLDDAGDAAETFGAKAASAASGVDRLIRLIPRLQQASDAQKKLEEAGKARVAALAGLNTGRPEEAAQIARVNDLYNQAVAEVTGLTDALKDQEEAVADVNRSVDEYLSESHLQTLDERARRIEVEARSYRELRAEAERTGASLERLAEIDRAYDRNVAGIVESTKPTGGGGDRLKERLTIEAELQRLAAEEIQSLNQRRDLVGKSVAESAEILAKAELIAAVERRRIPLTKEILDQIEIYAKRIGGVAAQTEAAVEAEKDRAQAFADSERAAEDLRDATERANSVLVQGLVSAGFQADNLLDGLGRILLKLAEIAASDFLQGAFGLQGSGSGFGNIFAGLGKSLFGSLSGGATSALGGGFSAIVPGLGFADGGVPSEIQAGLLRGRGGPRADKNLAFFSPGEMLINARSTGQNRQLLDAINDGGIFRSVDLSGAAPTSASRSSSSVFAPQNTIYLQGGASEEMVAQLREQLEIQQATFSARWRREQKYYDERVL